MNIFHAMPTVCATHNWHYDGNRINTSSRANDSIIIIRLSCASQYACMHFVVEKNEKKQNRTECFSLNVCYSLSLSFSRLIKWNILVHKYIYKIKKVNYADQEFTT